MSKKNPKGGLSTKEALNNYPGPEDPMFHKEVMIGGQYMKQMPMSKELKSAIKEHQCNYYGLGKERSNESDDEY